MSVKENKPPHTALAMFHSASVSRRRASPHIWHPSPKVSCLSFCAGSPEKTPECLGAVLVCPMGL